MERDEAPHRMVTPEVGGFWFMINDLAWHPGPVRVTGNLWVTGGNWDGGPEARACFT